MSGQDANERFRRSVEADIATAEADQGAKRDPKGARNLYRYARDLIPEDPEVWYQSARFELGQNKPDTALKLLDEALRRDAGHTQAAYDRAVLLVQLDRDAEAKVALDAYRKKRPDDSRIAYYLGLYAFEAGDNAGAKALFDEARKGDSQPAAAARAYYALLATQDKDPDGPRLAAEALPTAPSPLRKQLEPIASLYSGAASGEASGGREQKWLDVRGSVGAEIDDNAAVAPLSVSGTDATSGQLVNGGRKITGYRLVESARLVFRPVSSSAATLELDGALVNAHHLNRRDELATYDYTMPTGTLRYYGRFGGKLKIDAGVDLGYRGLWTDLFGQRVDRTHFLNAYGGSPSAGLVFGPRHMLQAIGLLEYRDYVDPDISQPGTPYDRDGWVASGGLAYMVPVWLFDLSLGGAYYQENAFGAEYYLQGGNVQLGARFNYKNTWIASAYGAANLRIFPKAGRAVVDDQTTAPGRLEQRYEFGGSVRWSPIPYMGVALGYGFTMNNAYNNRTHQTWQTLDGTTVLDYRRHVGSLTLIGQY